MATRLSDIELSEASTRRASALMDARLCGPMLPFGIICSGLASLAFLCVGLGFLANGLYTGFTEGFLAVLYFGVFGVPFVGFGVAGLISTVQGYRALRRAR